MEIRFQPALLQEVIDSFAEKTEREGDPTYYNEFHELADPIYEKFALDNREPEFKRLYQHLFAKALNQKMIYRYKLRQKVNA